MRRALSRQPGRWTAAALCASADAALAAGPLTDRTRGSACCSSLCTVVFAFIFRQAGVSWPLSFGVALLPGVFGWFVWKERDQYGVGIRVFALVLAVLQILLFVAGAVAAIALPGFVARHAPAVPGLERQDDDRPPAEELPFADPNDTLGLHPEGSVDSTPPGATVFLDDVEVGKTPLKTRFHAGRPSELRLELDGYFPVRRRIEVNANQHVDVRVVLERGAHVEVATDPPGAQVRFDGGVVLAATPGATALLPVGPTELVVLLPGYVAERRVIDLEPGPQGLAVPLTPGIKVLTASTPDHAAVALDGVPLGETPLDVYVPKKGAHTLTFSLPGLTPVRRVLKAPREGQKVQVKLVDGELLAAERKVAKAQAAYDKANQELEKLQRILEAFDTAPNERKVAAAEKAMEKAATALEKAEAELAALRERRGIKPPPSTE
jgi:hypothetical protein